MPQVATSPEEARTAPECERCGRLIAHPGRLRPVSEVATLLHMRRQTVYALIHAGDMDAVKLPGDHGYRVSDAAYAAYVARHAYTPPAVTPPASSPVVAEEAS